jgi:hypothetical protein
MSRIKRRQSRFRGRFLCTNVHTKVLCRAASCGHPLAATALTRRQICVAASSIAGRSGGRPPVFSATTWAACPACRMTARASGKRPSPRQRGHLGLLPPIVVFPVRKAPFPTMRREQTIKTPRKYGGLTGGGVTGSELFTSCLMKLTSLCCLNGIYSCHSTRSASCQSREPGGWASPLEHFT